MALGVATSLEVGTGAMPRKDRGTAQNVESIYRRATNDDCARDRAAGHGGAQRSASIGGSASCRSRHRPPVSSSAKRGRIVAEIPADVGYVKNLTLCTVIGDEHGVTVGTVEHLLAALRGLSVDNCIIEIDSKEVPIMDGSAAPFVEAIDEVGIRELSAPRKFIKVLKPIRVEEGDCWGELVPHSGFHLDVEIDFDTPLIGRQRLAFEMSPGVFRNETGRRPHLRLHERRGAPLEGRSRARRLPRPTPSPSATTGS